MQTPTPASPTTTRSPSSAGLPTGGCGADAGSPTPTEGATEARRAVAYVRESSEEQGQGFSPDAHREAIGRFAAEGRFDVVLVFHTSRFARSQVEARQYKKMLRERLGIKVVSVTQPMGEDPSDPSSFLAESIHEMFDEYYSVSLSFWTRSGLKEKARQGHLTGSLPWGYVRDPDTRLTVIDPEKAALVRGLFERYAGGNESDRSLAAWLNATGARTARGRGFGKDSVREMLCNTAYAGYVGGLRDKSRAIRGLHEAIVSDELFDRVQEVRSWRTTVVRPGRPSEDYLMRKLLHCERCEKRMHGTRGSRAGIRRYQCSTRRHHGDCEQKMVRAEPLEEQLIEWLHAFQPGPDLRRRIIEAIRDGAGRANDEKGGGERRRLLAQLGRLRDLYLMGDLTKSQYVMRRQALEEEVERIDPPTDPHLDRARRILDDFGGFWSAKQEPAERRKLVAELFRAIWQKDGRIVAVRPRPSLAPYFTAIRDAQEEGRFKDPKGDRDYGVTKAGATGLEPATSGVTGRQYPHNLAF